MMQASTMGDLSPEMQAFVNSRESIEKVMELAERCHLDSGLLDRLNRQGDRARETAFADFGVDDSQELEVVFVANADEVEHFVISPDPNAALSDEHLVSVAGGSTASTVGTAGTASSVLTFTSFSSVGTVATLGCAGSAG